MFYILALALFIVLYIVFERMLSSLVKGCITALFIVILVSAVVVLIRSTRAPVVLFNMFVIDNLKITRIQN